MANLHAAETVEPKSVRNMSSEVSSSSAPEPPAPPGLTAGSGPPVAAMPVLLPSFSDACRLVSAPYSCLVMKDHRTHLALSPMFLRKKRTGIQQELDAELLRYSERLYGVPLAYDDIRIVSQHGDIYDDSGYIHLDIQANYVIFQPKEGQRLLGTVNKLGATFVGCLVHGSFNASIHKPGLVSVDVWRDAGPRIGSHIEFEVSQLDADTAGVLLIRGRLDRTRVQEMLALGESAEVHDPVDGTQSLEPPGQDSTDQTPKKKKKKKKKESAEDGVAAPTPDQQTDAGVTQELNGAVDGKKKKKKKKEKHLKEAEEHVEPSAMEVQNSDSSGYLSDKPSKKRKQQQEDEASAVNGDPGRPKSKKKRKSDIQQAA